MGWRDLLQTGNETVIAPWLRGRVLRDATREWRIDGALPREAGWYRFRLSGRHAAVEGPAEPAGDDLLWCVRGYLVGDRLVSDGVQVGQNLATCSEPVALLEPGLDRFVRIVAGRPFEDGPLVFRSLDLPLGAEDAVLQAFWRRAKAVDDIPHVHPALDMAFRVESWMRDETEKRRAELEKQRVEEEQRRQIEERRDALAQQLGTGQGRRAMAIVDFLSAATAALRVGGAEYVDHKVSPRAYEMLVTFRMLNRLFACSCDARTLRITDAGVCLTDHRTGERGDERFTLESLPVVIREAHRTGVLVVMRRVEGDREAFDDDDDD